MAVSARSYGTASGVAGYVGVYTSAGSFSTTTLPTLAHVEAWIDQVSALLNTALAKRGFTVPLTQADAVLAAKSLVEQLVSDLAQAANSSGRFFSERFLERGVSNWSVIRNDISNWVEEYASGLEELGESRGSSSATDIGFRSSDNSGDEAAPIFQRKAFGNDFQNWDQR
jgi:hypothetical protein